MNVFKKLQIIINYKKHVLNIKITKDPKTEIREV